MKKLFYGCALLGMMLSPFIASAEQYAQPYTDIGNHYAKQEILAGYRNGLFSVANGKTKFEPERYMTRGEFVAVLDRLFLQNEQQLYPLLMLSEHDELGLGEGFDEPHLPYDDVDRMTWLYQPVLRMEIAFNKMYGPDAMERIFSGKHFLPHQPISKGEAAQLFALFCSATTVSADAANFQPTTWLADGNSSDKLKRGDVAILVDKVNDYLKAQPILPLLDPGQTKFPLVPEIEETFPLFGTFTEHVSPDESLYLKAVATIRSYNDAKDTFTSLQKLADEKFYNQIGVHYYLSWNPEVSLKENMKEAFAAIDAYFADKVIQPEMLQLLVANVYDLSLKLESEDPKIYESTLVQLKDYEKKMQPQSSEWQALAIYEAAMKTKSGHIQQAIDLYKQFPQNDQALLNGVYYLYASQKVSDAEQLLQAAAAKGQNEHHAMLVSSIRQELSLLLQQSGYRDDLSFALHHTENKPNMTISGESELNGYAFKYQQTVDNQQQFTHVAGYYQAPDSLVLQKLETYYDDRNGVEYLYDFDEKTWSKKSKQSLDYMHEWVDKQSVFDRASKLNARYLKQSFGPYDVITEWIPAEQLRSKAATLRLGAGKLKSVPVFVNKYYIDRKTNLLVRKVWRYEEIYDKEYAAFFGSDLYQDYGKSNVVIPQSTLKGAVEQK